MVALEWVDVEPLIGCKVSDYIIQHKRVEDPLEAEVYTGRKTMCQELVDFLKLYRDEADDVILPIEQFNL